MSIIPDTRILAFFAQGDTFLPELKTVELSPEFLEYMDMKYLVKTNYCPSELDASKENEYNSVFEFATKFLFRMGENLDHDSFRQVWLELTPDYDMNLWSILFMKYINDRSSQRQKSSRKQTTSVHFSSLDWDAFIEEFQNGNKIQIKRCGSY